MPGDRRTAQESHTEARDPLFWHRVVEDAAGHRYLKEGCGFENKIGGFFVVALIMKATLIWGLYEGPGFLETPRCGWQYGVESSASCRFQVVLACVSSLQGEGGAREIASNT